MPTNKQIHLDNRPDGEDTHERPHEASDDVAETLEGLDGRCVQDPRQDLASARPAVGRGGMPGLPGCRGVTQPLEDRVTDEAE